MLYEVCWLPRLLKLVIMINNDYYSIFQCERCPEFPKPITFWRQKTSLFYRARLKVKNNCNMNYISQYSKASLTTRAPPRYQWTPHVSSSRLAFRIWFCWYWSAVTLLRSTSSLTKGMLTLKETLRKEQMSLQPLEGCFNDSRKQVQELWGLLAGSEHCLVRAPGYLCSSGNSTASLLATQLWTLQISFRLQYERGEEERRIKKLVWRRVQSFKGQSKQNSLFSLWWFRPSRKWWNWWAQAIQCVVLCKLSHALCSVLLSLNHSSTKNITLLLNIISKCFTTGTSSVTAVLWM